MTIELYYLNLSPPCRAVLMTAKHLAIPVHIKNIDLAKGEQMTPEYLKINPTHTVPSIVDGDLTLWESRAIMQYLCNKYAPDSSLYPKDPNRRALVDRWLNTDSSYFKANINALVVRIVKGIEPTERDIDDYKSSLILMDTLIGSKHYLVGDQLTIADLSVLATTTLLSINDYQDIKQLPNLKRWYETIQKELPYYNEVNGGVDEGFKQIEAQMKAKK